MNLETVFVEKGLKKNWLAKQLGVRPETVSRWLRNPEKIPAVKRPIICKLMQISEDVLISKECGNEPYTNVAADNQS